MFGKSGFGVALLFFGKKNKKRWRFVRAKKIFFSASLKWLLFSHWLVLQSAFNVETLGVVC